MKSSLYFSVIIPTFNRKEKLIECLQSLDAQTYLKEHFEVLIVDDGSTDETQEVVHQFKDKSKLSILYLRQNNLGPGSARNTAAQKASGVILAFTEDDVLIENNWLEKASKYFQDESLAGCEGRTTIQNSTRPLRIMEQHNHLGFLPCNLFIRKNVFFEIGGYSTEYFDTNTKLYFREDADFGYRLIEGGLKFVYADDIVVSHPPQFTTWQSPFRHVKRFFFDALLMKRHPKLFRETLEVKRIGVFKIHRPFHYLALLFFVSCFLFFVFLSSASNLVLLFVGLMFVSVTGMSLRYIQSDSTQLLKLQMFIIMPLVSIHYLFWFVKGCVRFKNFRALL
ncbi:MAG: glycosyltransferase family 2 protein [Ignavibacteriae bacterium]|nr:glycosyltransferase family 2 protein [Ignavibacteriota bacterium]